MQNITMLSCYLDPDSVTQQFELNSVKTLRMNSYVAHASGYYFHYFNVFIIIYNVTFTNTKFYKTS